MNLSDDQITEIFFELDDFYKEFKPELDKLCLKDKVNRPYSERKLKLSYSEVMTILIAFHLSGARCLKHYYLYYVKKYVFLQSFCGIGVSGIFTPYILFAESW